MRGPAVIYVGNLPNDIKERELQELFDKVRGRESAGSSKKAIWGASRAQRCPARHAEPAPAPMSPHNPQYGDIRAIDIKIPPRPPPFAFIEFSDPR
jgi:RNA recognition motif-containing protein